MKIINQTRYQTKDLRAIIQRCAEMVLVVIWGVMMWKVGNR